MVTEKFTVRTFILPGPNTLRARVRCIFCTPLVGLIDKYLMRKEVWEI